MPWTPPSSWMKRSTAPNPAEFLAAAARGGKGGKGGGAAGGFDGFGAGGGFPGQFAGAPGAMVTREERIRVVADPATNALLIKASPLDFLTIRNLIDKQLDGGHTDALA